MKKLLGFIFIFLLIGSVSQEYYQKGDKISLKTDLTKEVRELEAEFNVSLSDKLKEDLEETCNQMSEDFECDANGLVLTLTKEFSGEYYTIKEENDFLTSKSTITINQIPVNVFSAALPKDKFTKVVINPIDLTEKEKNYERFKEQRLAGTKIFYSIEVQGEIKEAYAGNYTAEVNGSVARFDLVEVLRDSDKLVVVTEKTNYALVILLAAIVIIIIVAFSFKGSDYDKKRKNKKKD